MGFCAQRLVMSTFGIEQLGTKIKREKKLFTFLVDSSGN